MAPTYVGIRMMHMTALIDFLCALVSMIYVSKHVHVRLRLMKESNQSLLRLRWTIYGIVGFRSPSRLRIGRQC